MFDRLSRASVCLELQAGPRFLSKWHPFCEAILHCACPCQRFPACICMLHFSHKYKGSGEIVALLKPWLTVYRAHLFAYFCKQDQDFSTNDFKLATHIWSAYAHVSSSPHASACSILHTKTNGSGQRVLLRNHV